MWYWKSIRIVYCVNIGLFESCNVYPTQGDIDCHVHDTSKISSIKILNRDLCSYNEECQENIPTKPKT